MGMKDLDCSVKAVCRGHRGLFVVGSRGTVMGRGMKKGFACGLSDALRVLSSSHAGPVLETP